MNNRQFLITAMFFLLVITGYNQFVALPRARAAQQAAEQQLKEQAAFQERLSERAGAENVSFAQAAPTAKPEELTTLDLPQADVTFSSKGAGIKTFLFKDIDHFINQL